MDLPHGLKGKVKEPVPTQDALQFKVEEVMEKKEELKETDIFESIEAHDKKVSDYSKLKKEKIKNQKKPTKKTALYRNGKRVPKSK